MNVPDGWAAFRQPNRSYYTLHWLSDDGTRIACGCRAMANKSQVTEVPNLTTLICSTCTMLANNTWKNHISGRLKKVADDERPDHELS